MWSVLAQLHPVEKHAERVSNYMQYESELNMDNIPYPVELADMEKFEKQNTTISISIFGLNENGEMFPLKLTGCQ